MNNLQHQAEFPPDKPPDSSSSSSAPNLREAQPLLGERVRAARLKARLTQLDLAGQSFSKSYVSAVERGQMIPSLAALSILAARLGVTLSWLLGEGLSNPTFSATPQHTSNERQAAMLNEAEQFLQQGKYEEALALFEQAGQQDKTSQTREQYARVLADQGRYQEAYEQMVRAGQETRQKSQLA